MVIIPFSSYLLGTRYAAQLHFSFLAAQYIATELSPRVPGGLGWEPWLGDRASQHRGHKAVRLTGLWLAFPAVAGAAVIWSAMYFYGHGRLGGVQLTVVTILWLFALAAVPATGWVLWRLVYVICGHPASTTSNPPN
ncbi:hypothetical protein ABZ726_35835 [Streptomyces hundungensis]|uniref:hypothetical protein n=1 Tax=Streptomyces hundungensis TaxID=1077946 RepID=UPI0033ECBB85